MIREKSRFVRGNDTLILVRDSGESRRDDITRSVERDVGVVCRIESSD